MLQMFHKNIYDIKLLSYDRSGNFSVYSWQQNFYALYIKGLVQERRNSSANAPELCLFLL